MIYTWLTWPGDCLQVMYKEMLEWGYQTSGKQLSTTVRLYMALNGQKRSLCALWVEESEMTCPVTRPLSLAAGLALDTCKPPVAAGEAGCACADADGAAAGWRAASCPAAPSAIHFNLNLLLSSVPAWSH